MNLMLQPLRKYADFQGRARRSEYWLFLVFEIIVFAVASVIDGAVLGGLMLVTGVVGLGLLVPAIALAFRRIHDIDRSAWWLAIGLIPIVGAIVLLVFNLTPGTKGPNRFGPDPKGADTAEVFA